MNHRLITVKSILWLIFGVFAVVTVFRFLHGLGAVTALTDSTPWGFWIAFDVMAGVALAAGGFVMAAVVYIFGREAYRPFARPAILTAFLGYSAVAVALLYDLGLPWNIWHPIIFPQPHSVLFEVAMCVMLYLTVLGLEFAPVALEHPIFRHGFFRAIHKTLKSLTIVLVIAGIVLSTLHQSSLGSLFLIQPFRTHALWYSPIIYVLFLLSAIALGLMMATLESLVSSWLFNHEARVELLSRLGAAAAIVLAIYLAVRLGDLASRGVLGQAFNGSWQSNLFLFEILLSAIVPAILMTVPRARR
ncbi:MAG: polysulfide reductase NrfD, partial [Candidatus Sumerlaeota bacterium]|nr:polysulfide reductase NrfD [Candidatus Sumerlaeota bacterium]